MLRRCAELCCVYVQVGECAIQKRFGFNRVLKRGIEEAFRIFVGSWFHSTGAAMQKERSPRVFELSMEGCSRRMALDDRRVRLGCLTLISWMI